MFQESTSLSSSGRYQVLRVLEHDGLSPQTWDSTMWDAQFFYYKAADSLSSGGLGTMGYGLPPPWAAQAAFDRQWIAVCGDGGFQMNPRNGDPGAEPFAGQDCSLNIITWYGCGQCRRVF